MKQHALPLLAGLLLGGALIVGTANAVVHFYVDAVRYAGNAPRTRQDTLPPCPPDVLQWRGGLCGNPRQDAGLAFDDVTVATPRGVTLRAWWVPATDGAPTVVFAHGVGADRREGLRIARTVHDAGWSLLLLDLSNHGTSDNDGTGARYGAVERLDVLAAASWVREQKRAPRVVGFGISMGGASVLMAAAADDRALIDGVVVEAPFASLPELLIKEGELRHLPRMLALAVMDELRDTMGPLVFAHSPAAAAAAVSPRPLLLIVDGKDQLVPAWHANLIYDLARQPKSRLDLEEAEHAMGFNVAAERYTAAVRSFLTGLTTSVTAARP
ncbi:MAG: alpha/beta hydrolase [Myxococcota bacterium]